MKIFSSKKSEADVKQASDIDTLLDKASHIVKNVLKGKAIVTFAGSAPDTTLRVQATIGVSEGYKLDLRYNVDKGELVVREAEALGHYATANEFASIAKLIEAVKNSLVKGLK